MLEALLALGLAAIFMSSLVAFLLVANRGSALAIQYQEANWRAQQGVEALETISFSELVLTEVGALNFAENEWQLALTGPESLTNGISRTVKVQEVQRDGDCEIVAIGGTVDTDSYFLESEVTWTDISGNPQTVTLRTLRTKWENPQGACFAPASSFVSIDVFTDANWHGQKQLRDVHITNNGTISATLEEVTIWWNNSEVMDQMFLGAGKIWGAAGPGSPSGSQVSGTELDVVDTTIGIGGTLDMHKVQFSNDMRGTTITIKLEFSDGSEITTDPFVPQY